MRWGMAWLKTCSSNSLTLFLFRGQGALSLAIDLASVTARHKVTLSLLYGPTLECQVKADIFIPGCKVGFFPELLALAFSAQVEGLGLKGVIRSHKFCKNGDVPGGPMVKTPCFHCKGHRLGP